MTHSASGDFFLALIERASRAPSSHNSHPWIFRIHADGIHLFADRARALAVNDPEGREMLVSCGCALLNLRVAAAHHRWGARVALFPDAAQPDLVARVGWDGAAPPDRRLAELFDAIGRRRTCRGGLAAEPLGPSALEALASAAGAESAWLHIVDDMATRRAVAGLVAEGDAAQWRDPAWRRELAAWLRAPKAGEGLAVPAIAAPLAQFVVRHFDLGVRVGRKDARLAQTAPALAVLGTAGDGPADRVMAGQALQRMLLAATRMGLCASFLNQPLQVGALRPRLAALLGRAGSPQALMPLGYPRRRRPATTRRPVEQVARA